MSKITNDEWFNPVWRRMLYSCTNMTTVSGPLSGLSIFLQCKIAQLVVRYVSIW